MHSLGEGVVLQQGIRTVAAKTGRVSQSQPAKPGSQFCSLLTIAPGKFAQLKFSNFEIRTIALRTRSSRRNMYGTRVWAFSPSSQPLLFPLLKVVFSSLQRGLSGPCRKKNKTRKLLMYSIPLHCTIHSTRPRFILLHLLHSPGG